jgi:hypothetical protein
MHIKLDTENFFSTKLEQYVSDVKSELLRFK